MHNKIGNIMYVHTYRRSSHNNNTTSCFIQLENWHNHSVLAYTLNHLDFHGIQLRAEETTFNFQFDDNEYSPKGSGCSSCKYAIQYKVNHHHTQTVVLKVALVLFTPTIHSRYTITNLVKTQEQHTFK